MKIILIRQTRNIKYFKFKLPKNKIYYIIIKCDTDM